jgi:hypothetical protein
VPRSTSSTKCTSSKIAKSVAEDLGRHDHERRVGIEREVAGHQADAQAVGLEVAELLVAQRLDRARVDRAPARLHRVLDRVLGDERLARARGGREQHVLAGFDRASRLDLEGIERVALPADDVRIGCARRHAASIAHALARRNAEPRAQGVAAARCL